MTAYINMVILNEDATKFLGLFKLKGPEFLLNKWNFPGGKREDGETSARAVVRETAEETGLVVSEHDVSIIRALRFDNGNMLDSYAVRLSDADLAKYQQLEDEPLQIFHVSTFLDQVKKGELQAAPDVEELIHKAILATEPIWQPNLSGFGI